jgi:Membrane bound beta barrel domain (DUF5777)
MPAMLRNIFIFFIAATIGNASYAQDTTIISKKDSADISRLLDEQLKTEDKNKTEYIYATFKTTRLINGHSVETTARGVMDLKVSHRFGTLNKGAYEFFGLDNATMRIGFDFGLTNTLMAGIGRSTFEKTFDAFFKVKILRQSRGKNRMPVTMDYVPTIALKTQKWDDPNQKNYFSSRMFYTHQVIIGRKFSEGLSLQMMPAYIHRNLAARISDPNDIFAVGIGGRQKLTKHTSFNIEYYYQIPGYKLPGSTNALSAGFDIETGGHVFQLHLTNSQGMTERQFISENKGSWGNGDILFGFNISRVFTIGKRR